MSSPCGTDKLCNSARTYNDFSPSDAGSRIESLASSLQAAKPELRWLARESFLACTAVGKPYKPGPKEKCLRAVLSSCDRVGIGWIAARLIVFLMAMALWSRQAVRRRPECPSALFIGIKAMREAKILPVFADTMRVSPMVVDSRRARCAESFAHPSLSNAIAAFQDATAPVGDALNLAQLLPRLELLVSYAMRGANYCVLLAAFRDLAARCGTSLPIAATTASIAAFAAIRAGFNVVYFPHGFLKRSLVFPDFYSVVGFNFIEVHHVSVRLGSKIEFSVQAPDHGSFVPCRCLAIVGDYGEREPTLVRTLIALAREHGYNMAIRPHPAGDPALFSEWNDVADVVIDREGDFEAFMRRHRPAVMATWFSTTIFDAVVLGVLPVTLAGEEADVVFPHREIAVIWPDERDRLVAILRDEEELQAAVTKARRLALARP